MTAYTITNNPDFGSIEIKFDGKPSEAIRDALKGLRFRWHGTKKIWYGYKTAQEVEDAIRDANNDKTDEPMTFETRATESYMGGSGFVGNNFKPLYGSELSQAIRDAIKADGIKGVTVSKDSYSMGQSITCTVRVTDSDIVSVDELVNRTQLHRFSSCDWITDTDDPDRKLVNTDEALLKWDKEKQDRVHRTLAAEEIENVKHSKHTMINQFCIDDYKLFTDSFLQKLHRVTLIAQSFNYDDSNSMVDYFNTHFYYSLYVKYSA